jgi:hypothetical protein
MAETTLALYRMTGHLGALLGLEESFDFSAGLD